MSVVQGCTNVLKPFFIEVVWVLMPLGNGHRGEHKWECCETIVLENETKY